MRVATLASEIDFDGWRKAARAFRLEGVDPSQARFVVAGGEDQGGLFDTHLSAHPGESRDPVLSSETQELQDNNPHDNGSGPSSKALGPGLAATRRPSDRRDEREKKKPFAVPKAFIDLAQAVILHRSADRFDLLYRLLWRLRDEPDLIKVTTDIDVADAMDRAKNVSRASHKMKAFVRFREVQDDQGEAWVAWFEPAHRVLERTAPFFARRFTIMRWSILTPDGCAFWDGQALTFGPPATRDMAPTEDEIEDFWKTYYASTFNPARLKTGTMQGEMPKRYWKNLPEAALIPELIAQASAREQQMVAAPASTPNPRLAQTLSPIVRKDEVAADYLPTSLEDLNRAVQGCRRCPLWRDATQGVCGVGTTAAPLMIVGEQPGDQEDLSGQPFVGPAGQVLNSALDEVGIDRDQAFVTNAVKHFKHEPRGKRRLHRTPVASEVTACRWWLDSERRLVKPHLIVALGATAAFGVLNRKVTIGKERGQPIALEDGATLMITAHPSYLLRIPDEAGRAAERLRFVEDLARVRTAL